jgi:tRNA G18 (ribose-2'-O)-methylase SpoU
MVELDRPDAMTHRTAPKNPVRLVLDDVRSRHNVGSIFRTADAFGAEGIVLCGFTPQPPHREIEKTALGATNSVPWTTAIDAHSAVEQLKAEGYHVVAVEQTAEAIPLHTMELPKDRPLALVLGNELYGVSDAVVEAADVCVVVPQQGSKHSLNVSVCAGVVLWWCSALPKELVQPFGRIT